MIPTFEDLLQAIDFSGDDFGVVFEDLCKDVPQFSKEELRKMVEQELETKKLWAPFGFSNDQSVIVNRDRVKLFLDYAKEHPDWTDISAYVDDLLHVASCAPWIFVSNISILVKMKYLQANDKLQVRMNPLVSW